LMMLKFYSVLLGAHPNHHIHEQRVN